MHEVTRILSEIEDGDGQAAENAIRHLRQAAAEVGVGLAMVLMIYRNRRSISLDELSEMKG